MIYLNDALFSCGQKTSAISVDEKKLVEIFVPLIQTYSAFNARA